jgi:succinate dehydrogenase / fumarate reductase iron-sulfur subunit
MMMNQNGIQPGERQITVRIKRFNPDLQVKPYWEQFKIPVSSDTTILDALASIKQEQDGSVTFRRSCRHAICGSCAMNVNGRNMLVCNRPVRQELDRKGQISLGPLPYLPVIKDLVVDRSVFWQQYQQVKPWLVPPDDLPEQEFRVTPDEVNALRNAEKCIMCGACYSACQVVALNKRYLGPHALLKAFLRVLDPRDTIPAERLAQIGDGDGVFRCHTIFNCIDACPKQLNPTEAIETLRKLAQKRVAFAQARQERQQRLVVDGEGS